MIGDQLQSQTGSTKYSLEILRDPQSESEIIASLIHDVTASEWILAPLHRTWYQDILWTYGSHYMSWNPRTQRLQPIPWRTTVPRATTNLILPKVEIGMQIFLDSMPKAKVVPTTGDQKDKDAAEVATGVLRYKDQLTRWSQKRRELAGWVVICGHGFVMASLDKANAKRFQVPREVQGTDPQTGQATEQQVPGKDGQPQMDTIIMADENCETISPFEIVPDWNARNTWEWRRYTHVRARTRDWIGRVFGSDARKNVKPDTPSGTIGTMGYYQLKLLDIQMRDAQTENYGLPYGYGGAIADFKYMEDSAVVMTRYELPSDLHPNGRMLIACGDQVLADEDYPYGDTLNLYQFAWSVLPGSMLKFGMVRNLISCQRRLNGIDTQTDVIRKSMGNPRVLAHRKSQVAMDLQTADPAHVISYKHIPGHPEPHPFPAVGPDPSAFEQRKMISDDMQHISGIHFFLEGLTQPGVTAGVSIEQLTEQAGRRFQAAVEDNREEYRRLCEMRLDIARDSNAWKEPREVPMVGQDGKRQSRAFQAADFTGNLQVEVEVVPITALSSAIKKQTVLQLMELGLINATEAKVRDQLRGLFGVGEFGDPSDVHVRRAQEQNEAMYLGSAAHFEPFDDVATHIETHILETKTERFRSSPPEIKMLFMQHITEDQLEAKQQIDAQTAPPPSLVAPPGGPVQQSPQGQGEEGMIQ